MVQLSAPQRKMTRLSKIPFVSLLLFLGACSQPSSPAALDVRAETARGVTLSKALHSTEELGSIADVVETVVPSVVSVTSTKNPRPRSPMELFFGGPGAGRPQQGLGSGVVLSKDGLVVTNNHVIEGADSVAVQTYDNREFKAKVIGADPKSDVAVLQLQGELGDLRPIPVGDSANLRLGEVVLAVGNPFGVGQTVTMGIVSATGRADMGIVDYENFIQTDAAINPGNSGGALVNMKGELVGINTAILSRSGGSMGIGFAIPTNMAAPIVDALRTHGSVTRGWLGVRIQDLNSDLSAALALKSNDGVLVADIQADAPAARAGLKSGDVVTHVGDSKVTSAGHFRNLIASSPAQSKVELTVIRAQKKLKVKVELGTLPADEGGPAVQGTQDPVAGMDGISLRPLDGDMRRQLGTPEGLEGAVIGRVAPGSKAAQAGLQPGDVILQVDRNDVSSPKQVEKLYLSSRKPKLLQIFRKGVRQFVVVK